MFLKAYPKFSIFWDALSSLLYLIKAGEGNCQWFLPSALLQKRQVLVKIKLYLLLTCLKLGKLTAAWRHPQPLEDWVKSNPGWVVWVKTNCQIRLGAGNTSPLFSSCRGEVSVAVSAGKLYFLYPVHLGVFFGFFPLFCKPHFVLEPSLPLSHSWFVSPMLL